MALKAHAGRRMFGVDMKIVDEDGNALPEDGEAEGELLVRGNAICSGYFANEAASEAAITDGWFRTGDVASIDPDGWLSITDRAKDLIKSGGEWISSIDVENSALSHPGVANAAVIAIPHPKWDERPLLVVQKEPGADPSPAELRDHVARHLAKWQVPDAVEFVDELPLTAHGKGLETHAQGPVRRSPHRESMIPLHLSENTSGARGQSPRLGPKGQTPGRRHHDQNR